MYTIIATLDCKCHVSRFDGSKWLKLLEKQKGLGPGATNNTWGIYSKTKVESDLSLTTTTIHKSIEYTLTHMYGPHSRLLESMNDEPHAPSLHQYDLG